MKLIKPLFEIIKQPSGIEGIYKMIELAGRTAYKSEHLITENSAKEFTDRMIKLNHGAPLEHGTIYLKFEVIKSTIHPLDKYYHNKYSKVYTKDGLTKQTKIVFVTTNFRILIENGWMDDLKYLCEPTEYHEKRICVRFILSRSIAQEYTRHRVFSFLMESQRYCNYSKDKFNNEVTFILSPRVTTNCQESTIADIEWSNSLLASEKSYFKLLEQGWKPQEAREVLPNATKTELVMTGFISDWEHFFKLRCSDSAHPQAKELAEPLKEEFIKIGYLK